MSVASLAGLHFGALVATGPDERARSVVLLTANAADLAIIDDLVRLQHSSEWPALGQLRQPTVTRAIPDEEGDGLRGESAQAPM